MPIFDTKRCRKWFTKECRGFRHDTAESLAQELGEALQSVAPTPCCITVPALIGDATVDDVKHVGTCWFCSGTLRYFYILYATNEEMQPYIEAVARKNALPVAAMKRAIASTGFKGGNQCFDAVEAVNFAALSPERKEHRNDCVRCNLRVDLWAAMADIELRK